MILHRLRLLLRSSATIAALAMTAALMLGIAPSAHAANADDAYVMAYFKESLSGAGNVNAVHLAVSDDALEWTPLNNNEAILTPTAGTGGIRDPFIHRLNDGTWVVLATDIADGNFWAPNPNIHVWTSPDLVNWSQDRLLAVNRTNPDSFSWAPSIHWDAKRGQYGITFSTVPAGANHSVITVSYTSDFVTATDPVVFYDAQDYDVIDSTVITGVNGMNYLYVRGNAGLRGTRSASLEPGSFTPYTDNILANGCTEAPTLVKSLTAPTWYLWGDTFCPNSRFDVWQGDLVSGQWTQLGRQDYTPPLNSKHNAIHPITAADRDRMVHAYGGTQWNRLKSFNFPGSYVRHSGFVGRIDELPFEPYEDSQWRLVPGLADPTGVSFESVNHPGQYLRHQNFDVRLSGSDGSAGFKADATFYKEAGLANAHWSSFRSYNYPDRYIRHSGKVLYLHEISGSPGREDATFRVTH